MMVLHTKWSSLFTANEGKEEVSLGETMHVSCVVETWFIINFRATIKNIITDATFEKTFQSDETGVEF